MRSIILLFIRWQSEIRYTEMPILDFVQFQVVVVVWHQSLPIGNVQSFFEDKRDLVFDVFLLKRIVQNSINFYETHH